MDHDSLLTQLRQQYSSGYIDISELGDSSYTSVFDQLGIAYRINIQDANGNGWKDGIQGEPSWIVFDGTIATGSSVLGLLQDNRLTIAFVPVQGTSEYYKLQIDLWLPASWVFSQSFSLLDNSVFNELRIVDPAANPSSLIIQAGRDSSGAIADYPALSFNGYIDQNSSVITVLTWFISGGVQNPVSGSIEYDAEAGTVDMNLPLATGSVNNLFGSTGPSLAIELSLYSGLNTALNLYESGVQLETDIFIAETEIAMRALYKSSLNILTFSVGSLALNFNSALSSIENLFGHTHAVTSVIPEAISTETLVIKGLSFSIGLRSFSIQYCWMGVSALQATPWVLLPGILSLSDINLDLTIYNPFGDSRYSFNFSAQTVFGNTENGLPLIISGKLPGLELSGQLNTTAYSLSALIQQLFGNTKGLPEEVEIIKLDFVAGVETQAYGFDLYTTGEWRIPFGTDNELVFRKLEVSATYDPATGPAGKLTCQFTINTSMFNVELDLAASNVRLYGVWEDPDAPIDYEDVAIALGMYGLPELPDNLDLNLTAASFELETAGPSASFTLSSASYGSAALIAGKDAEGNWGFVFGMIAGLDLSVDLTNIDVVGNFVPEGMDVISVDNLRFVGATSAIPLYTPTQELNNILGTQINSGLVLSIDLNIGTLFSETFSVRFGGLDDGTASDVPPTTITEGDEGNSSQNNTDVQLDVNTAGVPAALPGPTSAWINVQRSFGPVHIARIGFRITEDESLGILLDAGVNLAGLTIGLSGLEADIPISAPFWPGFSLAGLEVGYVTPGLTIAGALIKTYGVTPTQYTGELILQAGSFGASAFGSYTTVNNEPSLFAFLSLNVPIGGPPFCVVTGLAFGFGYNRRLILPSIENVQTYPLVQAAMGITDPQQTINALNQYIVPADNQYWLAAGIRFTSFEMLNAYALLTASFGTQIELALMGEALFTLPLAVPGEENLILAQADMVLLASINPSLGQLAIDAQLTSRSFVLDRNAQITGGFALYFWFGNNTHAGDFVVTLGGYNPYFNKPAYYPRVPLLGLNWQISSLISIKGGLYCALTPGVIMAGGNLSASFSSGNVKAWFTANADFLMRYKPFSFDATIAVSVGASYKLNLLFTTKTVSVTVGASLHLWGPPFAGKATVDLGVMSFDIAFGAAKQSPPANITWTEFRNSFLPPEPPVPPAFANQPGYTQSLIRFNADRGMLGTIQPELVQQDAGQTIWQMNPGKTRISITCAVPSTGLELDVTNHNTVDLSDVNTSFGIGPVGIAPGQVRNKFHIDIQLNDATDIDNFWHVNLLTENVPAGLWMKTTNSMSGDAVVKNVFSGIQLIPKPQRPDVVAPIALQQLLFYAVPAPRALSWSPTVPPNADYLAQGMSAFQTSLGSSADSSSRNAVLSVLSAQGLTVYSAEEIELDGYINNAQNLLYAAPRMCYLGETTNTSQEVITAWQY